MFPRVKETRKLNSEYSAIRLHLPVKTLIRIPPYFKVGGHGIATCIEDCRALINNIFTSSCQHPTLKLEDKSL
jgi:hypothetical protein